MFLEEEKEKLEWPVWGRCPGEVLLLRPVEVRIWRRWRSEARLGTGVSVSSGLGAAAPDLSLKKRETVVVNWDAVGDGKWFGVVFSTILLGFVVINDGNRLS